jgi:hypothetical protein
MDLILLPLRLWTRQSRYSKTSRLANDSCGASDGISLGRAGASTSSGKRNSNCGTHSLSGYISCLEVSVCKKQLASNSGAILICLRRLILHRLLVFPAPSLCGEYGRNRRHLVDMIDIGCTNSAPTASRSFLCEPDFFSGYTEWEEIAPNLAPTFCIRS